MKFLENAAIAKKTGAVILLLSVLALGITAMASFRLVGLSKEYGRMVSVEQPSLSLIEQANEDAISMVYAAYRVMAYDGASKQAQIAKSMASFAYDDSKEHFADAAKLNPAIAPKIAEVLTQLDVIHVENQKAVELGGTDQKDAARAVLVNVDLMLADLCDLTSSLREDMNLAVEKQTAALEKNAKQTVIQMVVIGVAGVLLGIAGGILVARFGIANPVARLSERMSRLAEGDNASAVPGENRGDELGSMARAVEMFRTLAIAKAQADSERHEAELEQQRVVDLVASSLGRLAHRDLTVRIHEDLPPAYQRLKDDFNSATSELEVAMQMLRDAADSISTGSAEIRAAADNLSRRTEQQAANLEESAAAMTQVTQTAHESAEGADQVNQLVNVAHQDATEGGKVVREAVVAMDAIAQSSRQIEQIVSLIDGIAFQTNLLALNAGVEAARAGDAGRGFAVVASEVRMLAQRSADAAKEIKDLINASARQVTSGVSLVGKTGESLDRIVGRVDQIRTLAAQISEATAAQSASIQQVNVAVSEMDRSTQQNAAMVEESTAASRSLASEATQLADLVSKFELGGSDHHRSSGPTIPEFSDSRLAARSRSMPMARGNLALAMDPVAEDEWNEF